MTLTANGKNWGRPKGTLNKNAAKLKELAGRYLDAALEEAARLAWLTWEPMFDKNGVPIMIKKLDDNGELVLNEDREPVLVQKMRRVPGATGEQARIAALQIVLERAAGKATQPVSGDDDMPGIRHDVRKVELEVVPVGTPLNDDAPLSDEESAEDEQQQVG